LPQEKREGYNFVNQIADALLEKLFYVWIRATTRGPVPWELLVAALRDIFRHAEPAAQFKVRSPLL